VRDAFQAARNDAGLATIVVLIAACTSRRAIDAAFTPCSGVIGTAMRPNPKSHTAQPRRDHLLPRFLSGQGQGVAHVRLQATEDAIAGLRHRLAALSPEQQDS
jgi:hypothetical protein